MLSYPRGGQVPPDYHRHVFERHPSVPDVVRVDEDDRPLVVTSRASVAQHYQRREPTPLDLCPELLEEFAPAFRAAASLARCGAHEYLTKPFHTHMVRAQGPIVHKRRASGGG